MSNRDNPRTPLSQLDAFFVAYQERAGIAMQLGVELQLQGAFGRVDLETAVARTVRRWPQLAQTLARRPLGLCWHGPPKLGDMVEETHCPKRRSACRDEMIDPFTEPPLRIVWMRGARPGVQHLDVHAHHAVADGGRFVAVVEHMLEELARSQAERQREPSGEAVPPTRLTDVLPWTAYWGPVGLWRTIAASRSWCRRARQAQARLALHSGAAGVTRTCERVVAASASTWTVAGAWIKAIHAHNYQRGRLSDAPVSLEIPVRLAPKDCVSLGNLVSPIVVAASGDQPLAVIAAALQAQFRDAIRQRAHQWVAASTLPGTLLPWPLFKRVAAGETYSGFATSHVTWARSRQELSERMRVLSDGRLRLVHAVPYTPVCRHMGAALLAMPLPGGLKLVVTYREQALSRADVEAMVHAVQAALTSEAAETHGENVA
jgi:hypothetical protein